MSVTCIFSSNLCCKPLQLNKCHLIDFLSFSIFGKKLSSDVELEFTNILWRNKKMWARPPKKNIWEVISYFLTPKHAVIIK